MDRAGWVRVNGQVACWASVWRPTDRIDIDPRRAPSRRSASPCCCTSRSAMCRARPKTATSRPWCWSPRRQPLGRQTAGRRSFRTRPVAQPGAGRPAGHRFHRPAGADAGRPRGMSKQTLSFPGRSGPAAAPGHPFAVFQPGNLPARADLQRVGRLRQAALRGAEQQRPVRRRTQPGSARDPLAWRRKWRMAAARMCRLRASKSAAKLP
jgi:hypothetical protein